MATRVFISTSTGRERESMNTSNSISSQRSIPSARSRTRKRWQLQNASRQNVSRHFTVMVFRTGKQSSRVLCSWLAGLSGIVKVESTSRSQPFIAVWKCFTPWRNTLKRPSRPSFPLKRSMLTSAVAMWSSFATSPIHTSFMASPDPSARTRQAAISECSLLPLTMQSVRASSGTTPWRNLKHVSVFSPRMEWRSISLLRNWESSWQLTATAQRSSKPSSLPVSLG